MTMTILGILGSLVGTLVLGFAGRWAWYRLGRSKDREAALERRVVELERQLKEQQDAPRTPDELARDLRRRGM